MKNPQSAEVHVLDRMMYLLEEGSVQHLAQQDTGFGEFVDQLYSKLHIQAEGIRGQHALA